MEKYEANKELKEYGLIDKVDKNKNLYLGKPIKCSIKTSKIAKNAINKCKLAKDDEIKFYNDYSILIMEDGGENLENYGDRIKKLPKNPENIEKAELFWIEAQRILLGLKIFLDNNIIHHDLKPQNIVYNEKKNRLNFIDFGIMNSQKKVINESKNSDYIFSIIHWSFPFELKFYNENNFNRLANMSKKEKKEYLVNMILELQYNENMNYFFDYILDSDIDSDEKNNTFKQFMRNYYHTLDNELKIDNYNNFLKKSTNTIDTYGVGIAFLYVLNNNSHLLEKDFATELKDLFMSMVTAHLPSRYEPNEVLYQYEHLLQKHNLLDKYKKHFEKHNLVDGAPIPNDVLQIIDSADSENIFNKTWKNAPSPEPIEKKCPIGKELNKLTNRCIKKCPEGFTRNKKMKCRKNKTKKNKNV